MTEQENVYCAVQTEPFSTIELFFVLKFGPSYASVGYSPACYRGELGSIPGQSLWDFWWQKWHWDRYFFEFFGFPLSVSFYLCSILILTYMLLLL